MSDVATIEKAEDFEDSPAGWAQRWEVELQAAKAEVEAWHECGRKIIKRFRDEREAAESGGVRLNLFSANVLTQQALLYGRTPAVSVERRFADAEDDDARVAGELLERLLNADIERKSDTYAQALGHALQDRLLPGLGQVRVRYVAEFEHVEVEKQVEVTPGILSIQKVSEERKTYECVHTDYVHWGDFLWSPARVWHEVRWVAFRAQMSREQLIARFGEEVGNAVPLKPTRPAGEEEDSPDPWARAEVWEIWDRQSKRVYWYVEGYGATLDIKDDPLKLDGFFPCPRPLLGVTTTDTLLPVPDYELARDQYNAVDELTARIDLLTKAIRVAGVYDKSAGDSVGRLVREAKQNELIPVDSWAAFAEKGGVRGCIDWLPLEQISAAIVALSQRREEVKADLYEVTGWSDLMRGQAAAANVTATEQSIKARFASVRLQHVQDAFATFATEVQAIKAEVVARWYDVGTIIAQANAQAMPDAAMVQRAVGLLKQRFVYYRVAVKPEAVSMQDFAAMRAERTELLAAVTQFVSGVMPLAQAMPGSMPFLLELLKWFVSGLKGSSQIEGVIDNAIAASQQAASQPQQQAQQPDPKLLVQQMKGQQDQAKIQAELQADLVRTQAEVQAAEQQERNQAVWNVREQQARNVIQNAYRPQTPGTGGVR